MNNMQQTARVGLFFLLGMALIWVTFETLSGGKIFKDKGYTLVYAEKDWEGKGLTRLLLFPTAQDVVALAASGTNGDNYGTGTREVVNWCAETARSNPLHVLGASFDSMELDFSRPISQAEALAKRIAIFCPDTEVDPEDHVAIAAFARELAAQGCCFFWWD